MISTPISVSRVHDEVSCLVLKQGITHVFINCPPVQEYRERVEAARRDHRVVMLTIVEERDLESHVLLLPWEELQLPDSLNDIVFFTGRIIQAGSIHRVEGHFKDKKGCLQFVK